VPPQNGFYCYLLECRDGTYYCGLTNNLAKRIKLHNSGKASRYTRGRQPVKLVHVEFYANRSQAQQREIFIKKLNRNQKQALINKK